MQIGLLYRSQLSSSKTSFDLFNLIFKVVSKLTTHYIVFVLCAICVNFLTGLWACYKGIYGRGFMTFQDDFGHTESPYTHSHYMRHGWIRSIYPVSKKSCVNATKRHKRRSEI